MPITKNQYSSGRRQPSIEVVPQFHLLAEIAGSSVSIYTYQVPVLGSATYVLREYWHLKVFVTMVSAKVRGMRYIWCSRWRMFLHHVGLCCVALSSIFPQVTRLYSDLGIMVNTTDLTSSFISCVREVSHLSFFLRGNHFWSFFSNTYSLSPQKRGVSNTRKKR